MSHINEIATQANREGKVKKREAFTALTRLAEIVDEEAVPSMATLYRYFLPDPPKRPKTDYEWVCRARGVEPHRPNLHGVFVLDGKAIATDGHRLHFAPAGDREQGNYDVAGSPITLNGPRPDVLRVIPKVGAPGYLTYASTPGELVNGGAAPSGDSLLVTVGANVPLNLQYLKEAVSFTPEDAFVGLSYASPTDPVLLSFADGRGAVIMPVRR